MSKGIGWKCRRGTKELDLLLMLYYEKKSNFWTSQEKDLFSELLDLNDEMLTSWLLHDQNPEPKFIMLVQDIKSNYLSR